VRVTYVGPRNYVPAGSHPGQLVNIPGLGDVSPYQQPSFARMVALSVTVSIITQLLTPVVLGFLRGKRP